MICCLSRQLASFPYWGPSFTQATVDQLCFLSSYLTNEDSRIRIAGIQALKNVVYSRHGNVEDYGQGWHRRDSPFIDGD